MDEKNQTNPYCEHYNFGGDGTNKKPSYPTEYGARCELFDIFFGQDKNGNLIPNCYRCKNESGYVKTHLGELSKQNLEKK